MFFYWILQVLGVPSSAETSRKMVLFFFAFWEFRARRRPPEKWSFFFRVLGVPSWAKTSRKMVVFYSVFLINHAGILENLGSNVGQQSIMNHTFEPFRALGSVRNGFAIYFSSRLSPPKLRTASKSSQNQSFPLNQ